MNLTSFINEEKKIVEKTIRVLVYPNITFSKDLTKDSYIHVIKKMIENLSSIRNDLYFYLILPKFMNSLEYDNTCQIIMDFPTYPPTMRSDFNTKRFSEIVESSLDFDIVFSHLPEHTHAIKNIITNTTSHDPAYFGYCHWFDFRDSVSWRIPSFNQNILGILEMELCYINTEFQKKLVLKEASETFNDKVIEALDEKLVVQRLGIDKNNLVTPKENTEKIIVFNHRPDKYKHYNEFIKLMKKLREQRQDFTVWIPLAESAEYEWIDITKVDKKSYYNKLNSCRVGFSPKQKYGGWSVSTIDGIVNGCPFIAFDDLYYKEISDKFDFFSNEEKSLALLNKYLDDEKYRNQVIKNLQEDALKNLLYIDEIEQMSNVIDNLYKKKKRTNTESTEKIVEIIKNKGEISKKQLLKEIGWGDGIKFGPYRRAIMEHENVYDSLTRYPIYTWLTDVSNHDRV